MKNYCQYCDTFHTDLLGKDKEKQEKRWNILTQVCKQRMCVVPQFVYQTNTFTLNADQFYNFTLSLYNF